MKKTVKSYYHKLWVSFTTFFYTSDLCSILCRHSRSRRCVWRVAPRKSLAPDSRVASKRGEATLAADRRHVEAQVVLVVFNLVTPHSGAVLSLLHPLASPLL